MLFSALAKSCTEPLSGVIVAPSVMVNAGASREMSAVLLTRIVTALLVMTGVASSMFYGSSTVRMSHSALGASSCMQDVSAAVAANAIANKLRICFINNVVNNAAKVLKSWNIHKIRGRKPPEVSVHVCVVLNTQFILRRSRGAP